MSEAVSIRTYDQHLHKSSIESECHWNNSSIPVEFADLNHLTASGFNMNLHNAKQLAWDKFTISVHRFMLAITMTCNKDALAIHINIPSWTLIYFAQNIAQSNYIYGYSTVAATNDNDYSLRILMTRKNWIVADNKLLEPSCWFNCTLPAKANLRAIILA